MKKEVVENIVITTLKQLIAEQAEAAAEKKDQQTTDNAPSDIVGLFTPAEERFLGKFDAYGTRHLGIIYSLSAVGIREFVNRSGKDLNITPEILLKLSRKKIIKFVPYSGFGRDDNYTIELQLSLNDVKGLGDSDEEQAENDTATGGAAMAGMGAMPAAPMPAPEVAWVVKYGDVLSEAARIANTILQRPLMEAKKSDVKIYEKQSRVLTQYPKQFITDLKRVIERIDRQAKTTYQKERVIADILDHLQVNLDMTPKQITMSYQYHKDQKRLQKYLDK